MIDTYTRWSRIAGYTALAVAAMLSVGVTAARAEIGEEALSSIPSPYAETGPAYGMTTSSAVLTAMVYPGGEETGLYDTKYRFEYGTTTGYGSDSSEGDAGSEITGRAVTVTIGSLTVGTQYFLSRGRLESQRHVLRCRPDVCYVWKSYNSLPSEQRGTVRALG